MSTNSVTISQEEAQQRVFMVKVYGWMATALAITGVVALFVGHSIGLLRIIAENWGLFLVLCFGEIFLVGYLVGAAHKMSVSTATNIFIGYSVLNGLTMSVIFLYYTEASIASTFFITGGTFAIMSIYGFVTKRDLTGFGSFLYMGLIGMIIASVVNIFVHSETIYWLTTYIGVIIFVGLTAYDTQKLKEMNVTGNETADEDKKSAILGALVLYLDFINLFLLLLRIFGVRRSD